MSAPVSRSFTLIGIAGGTASGKTTVARRIIEALPAGQAALIQQDAYYRDRTALTPAQRVTARMLMPRQVVNVMASHHRQDSRRSHE